MGKTHSLCYGRLLIVVKSPGIYRISASLVFAFLLVLIYQRIQHHSPFGFEKLSFSKSIVCITSATSALTSGVK